MDPENAEKVARIFAEHDDTDLPRQVGVTARTLLHYQGLTFHLIESEEDIIANVMKAHEDNPEFRELNEQLRPYLSPIVSDWHDIRDSQAREFYHRDWAG
jgi:molybdate-binding protein